MATLAATIGNEMMDVLLGEEQLTIRSSIRELAQNKIAPRAKAIDESGEFPWDIVELFREHDVFSLPFPTKYGGLTGSALTLNVAIEEIAKVCATSAVILAVQGLGGIPILLGGTDEQKQRWIPELSSGKKLIAYGLSEPGAGSDPAGMQTTAKRVGDTYVLNGSKLWITEGGVADYIVVFCKTDPELGSKGISAIVVPRETKGITTNVIHGKLGIRGSNTAEIFFDNAAVPAENLLGAEGEGFKIAMGVLDRSRPGIASQALGIAQGALDYAAKYATQRQQFGKPISDFQGIQFMLADMEAQTQSARAVIYTVSKMIDEGRPGITRMSAIAKLVASDTAMKVATDAVQILGGYGYVNEYPVERMMRDAKITQIYEGTNQIQRLVIARELLRSL
jgi:alkylation response protein AidB-like acyl-CoA dehydrogenase